MYLCKACGTASRPGNNRLTFTMWKPGSPRQIAAEVPVCRSCHAALLDGVSWHALVATKYVPEPVQPEVTLEPQPLPVRPLPAPEVGHHRQQALKQLKEAGQLPDIVPTRSQREEIIKRMRGNQRIL